jgi:hypothetical protein
MSLQSSSQPSLQATSQRSALAQSTSQPGKPQLISHSGRP